MERLTHRRARTLLESFNFAVEGIIHVLRTQRNMRIHMLAAVIVLVAALATSVTKLELIALLLAIAFVFIAEMFNSALEQAIDVSTTSFDPLAKLAKDIAAGAVLIATLNAIAVVTIILVIAAKAYTGRGRPLSGGLPSGHAAVAFAGWMAATLVISDSHRFLISTLTLIMALLVAQTRVESGIHSALEVTYGGVLGALVTLAVFQLFA
jgi:diacylglycerol kinase (ATP)